MSTRLSAAEIERLERDMPDLESCRRPAAEPDDIAERTTDGGSVTFENLKQPSRNLVIVDPAAKTNRPACVSYEYFVVSLIKRTLDSAQARR